MSFFYFVEILNASSEVQARHKLTDLPIRLGRSYSNDIILDDHHTAAEHAIIEQDADGKLIVRDLGNQNSIRFKGKTYSHIQIDGDTVVQLGHTHVRVRDSHYTVSEEVSDSAHSRWQGWPEFAGAIAIICVLSLTTTWLADITDSKLSDYIMNTAAWLGFSVAWAGIWSIAHRVFGGSANFPRHLFILSCSLIALDVLSYLCMFLGFAFSWEVFTHYNSHLEVIVVSTLIYYHLRYINSRKRQSLKIICASLAVIASSLILMSHYQKTNQYADELYMTHILPPAMRISRNHSLAEFNQSIEQLKTEIDAEREKVLKEKAQKNKTTVKP